MAMARQDPLRNFRFRVEIDGIAVAGFSEALVGSATTDVIEYREGTDPMLVRKLPGLSKFNNIVFWLRRRSSRRSIPISAAAA